MRIRELRQEYGYTQEELGKKIGQTKSNISKYETGALEPSIETLKTLSNIFNVSLDYLLGKSNTKTPKESQGVKQEDFESSELSEKDIITLAAHKVGHEGDLTDQELEKVKLALKIALMKEDK